MSDTTAALTDVAPEALASALASHGGYRVLKMLGPILRSTRRLPTSGGLLGCALDVETTGLDHRSDAITELALQRFWADPEGRIVATGRRLSWFDDPGIPISEEITRLTGITGQDVAGRSIIEAVATSLILDAAFVVSHNAAFDRPFVERRLPLVRGQPWVCTLSDVDWRGHGFDGRKLSHLLSDMGWFYRPHRAQTDVDALLHLLDHPLTSEGTVLKAAVDAASTPSWKVSAIEAPFAAKDTLRLRGYRWAPDERAWWREVADRVLEDELAWAVGSVYQGRRRPRTERITWRERYASVK